MGIGPIEQDVVVDQQQSAEQGAPEADKAVAPEAGAEGQQPQAESKPVDTAAEDTKKALRGVQKRINELTRAKHEAEEKGQAEAEYWRQQAIALAQERQQAASQQQPVFTGDLEHDTRELARFEARRAAQEALEQDRKTRQDYEATQQQAAQQASMRQSLARVIDHVETLGEKQFPGFRERISGPELPTIVNTAAFAAILETGESAPAILNYLGNNPGKAHELVALSPVAQAKEIGRIEAAIASGRIVSNAPPPPSSIGTGRSPAQKDPASMTYDEFVKFRRKQIAARH